MTNDRQSPADVRDLLADLVERCRTRWSVWASVSPAEWPSPMRWGIGAGVLLGALTLSWSMWWLVGLPARTSLNNDIAAGRTALDLATSQAKQLPQWLTALRNAEAETVAWERLLPVAPPEVSQGALADSASAALGRLPDDARQSPRDAANAADTGSGRMWRADLESFVARAGLVLEMARPGAFDSKAGIDTERAEMRVTGPVAGLIGLLAEIDRAPRHLVIERLNLQAPDTGSGHDGDGRATLKVTIATYVWHRTSAASVVSHTVPMPKLPDAPAPWQMPTAMVDVFRASLTGRPGQASAAMVADPPVAAADVASPIGVMQAGARRVTFRRAANGVTADWAGPAHPSGQDLAAQISVTLHGVDTVDALKAFARLTGRNLVLGERVAGRLEVEMANVSPATAFEVLIRVAGLGVRSLHGVDWVAPKTELLADEQAQLETAAKRETMQPLVSRRFTLNYPRALELREVIIGEKDRKTQRLLSSRGSLIADPRTNQLFVTDLPERLDALGAFIARIDVPVRQVLIEARIVEADDRFSESLGVNLAGYYARTQAQKAGKAGPARGGTASQRNGGAAGNGVQSGAQRGTQGSPGGAGGQGLVDVLDSALPAAALAGVAPPSLAITLFGRSATRFLQLELSALETSGRGRVVSRPRVVTADKAEAVIEQGTELPYQARSGRRSVSTVQFRKATLRLEVTPLITPGGQVILDVDVRKDSVGQAVADGFAVDTRHVKTQVQVEDGGTVAIGGIYQEERRDSRAQVPWLGDVPLLGALFRNRSEEDRRTELLVFITPSVVPEAGGVDADIAPRRAALLPGDNEETPAGKALRGGSGALTGQPAVPPEAPANDAPVGHPRLTAASLEATRSARPTHIPVSSGIGTQISAIHAGKRNTCRIDGGGQDHGRTRRRATSRTAVL
ncbi:Type IV pilus biogenesis and competence protein PilQ [Pandoraea iniqua]|uniref:Type IV pilus biogenesis and competence protein PilQ n=1 Tax=Pandoraea iniqua TaxID=2508288 RepID=A0A5E4ZFG7_9BURK|nr:type IV pilus secretin PilQ [Pandoraea iniqua]VVE58933.1 Type IV pilus biogenesis and competence protein PilQ [Pandoraea iniqua]